MIFTLHVLHISRQSVATICINCLNDGETRSLGCDFVCPHRNRCVCVYCASWWLWWTDIVNKCYSFQWRALMLRTACWQRDSYHDALKVLYRAKYWCHHFPNLVWKCKYNFVSFFFSFFSSSFFTSWINIWFLFACIWWLESSLESCLEWCSRISSHGQEQGALCVLYP